MANDDENEEKSSYFKTRDMEEEADVRLERPIRIGKSSDA